MSKTTIKPAIREEKTESGPNRPKIAGLIRTGAVIALITAAAVSCSESENTQNVPYPSKTEAITNANGEGIGAEFVTTSSSGNSGNESTYSFKPSGNYTVPLNVSSEAAVMSDDPMAKRVSDEFLMKHSANGQWTYTIVPVNQVQHPGSGVDIFMFAAPGKNRIGMILIKWFPKEDGPIVIELEKVEEKYQRLDATPIQIKIDGNEAQMVRYKSSDMHLIKIGLCANDKYYSMEFEGEDFNGPGGAFDKTIKMMKFK